MSATWHALLAFVSGVALETIYTLNVIFVGERQGEIAAVLAVLWGAVFLVGVNESFRTWRAAVLWCVGLGFGTLLGVWLKRRKAKP